MYTIAISVGLGLLAGVGVSLFFSWWAAILPALLVGGGCFFFLARKIGIDLRGKLEGVRPLLEAGDVEGARSYLTSVKNEYGKWQILLDGQIDGQLGMIDYMRMRWDKALPQLEAGRFQNGAVQACIGLVHHRKGRKDEAYKALGDAASTSSKEVVLHLVRATVLQRDGKGTEALEAINQGLEALPDNEHLKNLKKRLANKKKIDVKQFPMTWYQFFPEDQARQMMMRGRKDGKLPGGQQAPQQRIGGKRAPRR